MQSFWEDVQFALRSFRKNIAVTILIVATLGMGIGANTAIFSMVYNVLLGPLPFDDGEQLVKIETNFPNINQYDVPASVQTMFDYEAQSETLDEVFEYHQMSFTLLGMGDPSFVQTGVVSWDYFNILGIEPILGRTFQPGEDEPGAAPLIILSYRYWQEKFAGSADVIGMTLEMNNRAHEVIGVLPPMPPYPMDNDIWVGAATCPARGSDGIIENRAIPFVQLYGKMNENATLARTNSDLESIVQNLTAQFPDAYPDEQGLSANVTSLRSVMARDSGQVFYLLLGMTALVLLIACANVANLNLARMSVREQELAVREALGANPGRIARQVLTESIILAVAGGVLGLIIAWFGMDLLADFSARYTPLASEVGINGSILVFSLIVAVTTGLVSGSLAAFQRRNLNIALKEGGGSVTSSSRRQSVRKALLLTQFMLAFIILTSAALITLSLYRLNTEDAGFRTESVLATDMTYNFTAFASPQRRNQFLRYLETELPAHPAIHGMGASSSIPLQDVPNRTGSMRIENHAVIDNTQQLSVWSTIVSRDYFDVLDIPLLEGRYFTDADDDASPIVLIINEAMADRYFPNESPIGQRLSFDDGGNWSEIVGVVGNSRVVGLDEPPVETLYGPYLQLSGTQFSQNRFNLFVRADNDSDEIRTFILDKIHEFEPAQAVTRISELAEIRATWLSTPTLVTQLVALFALLAFAITLSGVIGVVSYNISQRFREIGLRMALGANPLNVRLWLSRQGLWLSAIGITLGALVMLIAAPTLSALLYETSPLDVTIYVGMALIITLVALLAISIPVNQAVQINPWQALRDQ